MTDPEALAAEGPPDVAETDEDEGDPLLLYARLAGDLPEIFKKDSASCFRSHPKFLLMGTVKGWLHVFDLEGNQVFKVCIHTGPVNDLSIEERGDYVATCSDDGTVVVTNICSQTHTKYTFAKPMQAVAFAVDFESMKKEKKSSFERWGMASGGLEGKLTITTKGLLGPNNNTIHQGEGAIHCIQWNGPFLAWANSQGVKVYDFARKRGLTYIARKSLDVDKVPVNEENYRACLAWGPRKDQDPYRSSSLVVGWGDSVTVAVGVNPKQSPRTRKSLSARAAHYQKGVASASSASYNNDFFFQVIANFRTDFLICGIGFFNEQLDLILLGTAPKKRKPGRRRNSEDEPDLLEVRVVSTDGRVELCSDALPASTINDSKQLTQPSNYRLAVPMLTDGDDPFYILCPKDILVLSPIRNANLVSSSQTLPPEVLPIDEKGVDTQSPAVGGTEQDAKEGGVGGGEDEEEDEDEEIDEEAMKQLEREKQELAEEEEKLRHENGDIIEEDSDGNKHMRDTHFQAAIETATGKTNPSAPQKHLLSTTKSIPLSSLSSSSASSSSSTTPPRTPVHSQEIVEDIVNTPVLTADQLLQKARDFLIADRQERIGGASEPTEVLDPKQFIQADAEEKMGIRRPISPASSNSRNSLSHNEEQQQALSSSLPSQGTQRKNSLSEHALTDLEEGEAKEEEGGLSYQQLLQQAEQESSFSSLSVTTTTTDTSTEPTNPAAAATTSADNDAASSTLGSSPLPSNTAFPSESLPISADSSNNIVSSQQQQTDVSSSTLSASETTTKIEQQHTEQPQQSQQQSESEKHQIADVLPFVEPSVVVQHELSSLTDVLASTFSPQVIPPTPTDAATTAATTAKMETESVAPHVPLPSPINVAEEAQNVHKQVDESGADDTEARIHVPRGSYDFTTLPCLPEGLNDGALFARQDTLQDAHGGFEGEDLGALSLPIPGEDGALFNRQSTLQDPHGDNAADSQGAFDDQPPNDINLSLSRQATTTDAHGQPIATNPATTEGKTNENF